MRKMEVILNYFDVMFPEAHCELEYSCDYELLIAIVLSAQTTDKMVNRVTRILFDRYPTIYELSNASVGDIEEIIRVIGSYHKKSIYVREIANRLVSECGGKVPNDREYLMTLPGVGRKTVNVFLAEFYGVPTIAIDTHVNRVSKRLGLASDGDDVFEVEEKLMREIPREKWIKAHHQFIFFGRYFCTARGPKCSECDLVRFCNYNDKK